MLLLAILIISILLLCNSYNLRGSNTYENLFENSLVNKNNNNTYENSLVNQNNTITYDEIIEPINKQIIDCHPDILPENCNRRSLYPYPINTKNYRICYQDTIIIDTKNNVYSFVKNHKLNLFLYTYLVYFDGKSAKADIQGWCQLLI
jgi:hypothetical protein